MENFNKTEEILQKLRWIKNNKVWKYKDCEIQIESSKIQTKEMKLFTKTVQVPCPVVPYLENLFGKNWKEYKS